VLGSEPRGSGLGLFFNFFISEFSLSFSPRPLLQAGNRAHVAGGVRPFSGRDPSGSLNCEDLGGVVIGFPKDAN